MKVVMHESQDVASDPLRDVITKAGQVSIPAEIRARWEASTVAIEDEGDRIVVRPVPDDPISALRGSLAHLRRSDVTAAEAVRQARDDDVEAERGEVEEEGLDVVLDASVAIALLLDEPSADVVETVLTTASARMSVVNAAEAVDVLLRLYAGTSEDVLARMDELLSAVQAAPATTAVATRAGELRARLWRRDRRISLADCFCLATAEPGDRIATLDDRLAAVARAEGHEVVELG